MLFYEDADAEGMYDAGIKDGARKHFYKTNKEITQCLCKQGKYLPKLVRNPACPIHGLEEYRTNKEVKK